MTATPILPELALLVSVEVAILGPAPEDIAALDPAPERRRAKGKGRCRWWLARPWRGVGDRCEYLPVEGAPADRDGRLPAVTLRAEARVGDVLTVGVGLLTRYDVTVPPSGRVTLAPVDTRCAALVTDGWTGWAGDGEPPADLPAAVIVRRSPGFALPSEPF